MGWDGTDVGVAFVCPFVAFASPGNANVHCWVCVTMIFLHFWTEIAAVAAGVKCKAGYLAQRVTGGEEMRTEGGSVQWSISVNGRPGMSGAYRVGQPFLRLLR